MSTETTVILTFAAITLLLGGLNELSVQLTLVGILAIILHAAITPTDLSDMYPNFDNHNPTQPPLRDYVLVFGLASLVLVSLLSRTHPLVSVSAHSHSNHIPTPTLSSLPALVPDACYLEGTASVPSVERDGSTPGLCNILENNRYDPESCHLTSSNTKVGYRFLRISRSVRAEGLGEFSPPISPV